MARRASGSATSLNTFARSNPYSLLSTSTILVLASPPSTPTRRPLQLIHAVDRRTRRRDDECDYVAHDHLGLGLRKVAHVSADHCEIHLAVGKGLGGPERGAAVHDVEPHRRIVRGEPAGDGGHRLGGLAVDRAHSDAQRHWTGPVPIGKEASAGHDADDAH